MMEYFLHQSPFPLYKAFMASCARHTAWTWLGFLLFKKCTSIFIHHFLLSHQNDSRCSCVRSNYTMNDRKCQPIEFWHSQNDVSKSYQSGPTSPLPSSDRHMVCNRTIFPSHASSPWRNFDSIVHHYYEGRHNSWLVKNVAVLGHAYTIGHCELSP